jgi:hypothetical protein
MISFWTLFGLITGKRKELQRTICLEDQACEEDIYTHIYVEGKDGVKSILKDGDGWSSRVTINIWGLGLKHHNRALRSYEQKQHCFNFKVQQLLLEALSSWAIAKENAVIWHESERPTIAYMMMEWSTVPAAKYSFTLKMQNAFAVEDALGQSYLC